MPDQKLKINVASDKMEAKYSDFAIIGKNGLGFNLDFGQRMPGGKQVNIISRVAMSPQHAKLLLKVLAKNVEKFEQEYGDIKTPEAPKQPKEEGMIHFLEK